MKSIIGVLTGVTLAASAILAPAASASPTTLSTTMKAPAEWRFHGYYDYNGCVRSMNRWAQELYPVDGCYSTPVGWFFYVYR